MAVLFITKTFQYNGQLYRAGQDSQDATLTVSRAELEREGALGRHPGTGHWLSPLWNHCQPADQEARDVMTPGAPPPPEKEEPDHVKVEDLRAEFDAIGKAYDRRWGEDRLQRELKKAKKEVGA